MTYKGIVKGRTIELDEQLPFPEGQPVTVSVEALTAPPLSGSPAAIREVSQEPPHLTEEEVEELEHAIE